MVCFGLKYNLPFKQIDETQVQIVSWNNQIQPNLVSSQLIQNWGEVSVVVSLSCPIVVTTSLVCKTCTSVSLFIWSSMVYLKFCSGNFIQFYCFCDTLSTVDWLSTAMHENKGLKVKLIHFLLQEKQNEQERSGKSYLKRKV